MTHIRWSQPDPQAKLHSAAENTGFSVFNWLRNVIWCALNYIPEPIKHTKTSVFWCAVKFRSGIRLGSPYVCHDKTTSKLSLTSSEVWFFMSYLLWYHRCRNRRGGTCFQFVPCPLSMACKYILCPPIKKSFLCLCVCVGNVWFTVWTIGETHLPKALDVMYVKSPTAQDAFRPIPGSSEADSLVMDASKKHGSAAQVTGCYVHLESFCWVQASVASLFMLLLVWCLAALELHPTFTPAI